VVLEEGDVFIEKATGRVIVNRALVIPQFHKLVEGLRAQ
jgi:hypothetical protein